MLSFGILAKGFITLTVCSRNTNLLKSPPRVYMSSSSFDNENNSVLPSLVYMGDQMLMQPILEPVDLATIKSDEFQNKLRILRQCQKAYGGIGIAAPQIGWRARVFCMGIDGFNPRYPDAKAFPFSYWINPVITPVPRNPDNDLEQNYFWEGCLSVPGMRGWVQRPKSVNISGFNENGEAVNMLLEELPARVSQHEYDHLDGILFPARAEVNTLLPLKSFEVQDAWAHDWPTVGSRITKPGTLSDTR